MTHTFEGDVPRFNQRFYEGDPAAYLRGRLDQWMATATEAGAFAAVRAESSTSLVSDNDGVDPAVLSFLVTDAVLLHHHAAETVVRYYLAHVDEHPAPWTVPAERRYKYHEVVQKRLLKPAPLASEVAYIVYGAEEPAPAANLDEWNNAVDGAIDFLRSMADTYLDGAPMYNSLKHGLGAATGRTDVSFVEDLADPMNSSSVNLVRSSLAIAEA